MTDKQRHIYNFIVIHYKTHGYPPPVEVIREAFKPITHQGMTKHLQTLVVKKFLRQEARGVYMPTYIKKKKL